MSLDVGSIHVCLYFRLLILPRSICQRNSWVPLQITKPMLDTIVSKHDLSPRFYELASCFYDRDLGLEATFCLPYTEIRSGPSIGRSLLPAHQDNSKVKLRWISRDIIHSEISRIQARR